MNPNDPKGTFLLMRGNGWSFRTIARKLGVPKSTLFNWESEPDMRRAINVIKSVQLERLQERYIPTFEEELQKLSTCLARVERALEKQDFEAMRPEFLLRTSLQLRSRLNSLRSEISPTNTLNHGEIPELPLPGCISRSESIPENDCATSEPVGSVSLSATNGEGRGDGAAHGHNGADSANANGATWDRNGNSFVSQPSVSTTSTAESGTSVPNSESPASSTPIESQPSSPLRPLRTSVNPLPDEIALTAGFDPADNGADPANANGATWDRNGNCCVSQPSAPTTSVAQSGTPVPNSESPASSTRNESQPSNPLRPLRPSVNPLPDEIAFTAGFDRVGPPAVPASERV